VSAGKGIVVRYQDNIPAFAAKPKGKSVGKADREVADTDLAV
jgi:hypothetical protein